MRPIASTVFLISFIAWACAGIFSCITLQADTKKSPNIIVILTDDQGWGDLSIHGNKTISTPHIDSLARDGALFDRFYVCPVCSPTRAEFLTGRYHVRGGVYSTSAGGERLDLDETTIGEVFKAAGYATGAFGKWHNGSQFPYHPNARGFDEFYGFCTGHWADYYSPMLDHNNTFVKGKGFVVDDFTDHALKFIETNKDNPFFAYIPYNTPHSPMQVPDKFYKKYDREMKDQNGKKMDTHYRAALAMCENVDWNVGRILKKLDDLKISDNTLIMYFSDNGPNGWRWNDGMKGRKGSTDEGGVRSPCLIRWPNGIKAGLKIEQIAAAIDLLPTLAEVAGIDVNTNKPIDGISLMPLLKDDLKNWGDRRIFTYWKGRTSVRTQRYRLDNKGKLFDMVMDPMQKKPIQDEMISNKLKAELATWEKEVVVELDKEEQRPHPVGHKDSAITWLPAGDGQPHGNVKRSNKFPNDSFFLNWVSKDDKITFDVDVLNCGTYEAELWVTCKEENVGTTIELSLGDAKATAKVTQAFDPPLVGAANDRHKRIESYIKDFIPLNLGDIELNKGRGLLTLRAIEIPGKGAVDIRFVKLTRK